MTTTQKQLEMNAGKKDTWCCQPTTYGESCSYPADYLVVTGDSPDDTTLLCAGHLEEVGEPHWNSVLLTNEYRQECAIDWEEWVQWVGSGTT